MPSFGAGTEERLCCRAGHGALRSLPFLMHFHLASAFQGEEEPTREGCFFKLTALQNAEEEQRGQLKDKADAQAGCQLLPLKLSFQSLGIRQDGGRASSPCHLAPRREPWWTQTQASEPEAERQR